MTTISAKVVAHSESPLRIKVCTVEMRYPKFIHAELMTHRMFSRNARSSRAVPVDRMIDEVIKDPVVPQFWGANQKGMQASEECNEPVKLLRWVSGIRKAVSQVSREEAWLRASEEAVNLAQSFTDAGYHKQVVNRLLEPFLHIDVLVTATEWENFFALRDHHMAEPHIAVLAKEVKKAMGESEPDKLKFGDWHLPYFDKTYGSKDLADVRAYLEPMKLSDNEEDAQLLEIAKKISVARCSRISYKPFDGNGSVEAEIKRHDDLVGAVPMHASPAEHQCTPDQLRSFGISDWTSGWLNPDEHGNLRGWRQYRKMLPGECTPG